MRRTWWFVAAVLVAGLAAAPPRPAEAHAALISSVPGPGDRVGSPPGAVVLDFSEPIDRSLSRAVVITPAGARLAPGAVLDRAIEVPVGSGPPGVYVVRWTTVSAVDGHVLGGELRFGVGVDPGQSAPAAATPTLADLAIAPARAVELAALLLAVGLVALAFLALRAPPMTWALPGRRLPLALVVALAAGLTLTVAEAMSAAPAPSLDALRAYLGNGVPGLGRGARLAAEAAALGLSLRGPRRAAPALLVAVLAQAASGHAAAVQPAAPAVAADVAHLLSAGTWAGGIMALATLRPPAGWRGPQARVLLRRVSPVALAAFAVTAATGVLRGSQELSGPGDLLSDPYGQVLGVKVVAVGVMVALSFLAWRRLRVAPRIEAALAVAIVAETALLAAFPLPPARLQDARAALSGPRANPGQPRAGDLALATSAGDTLIGLALRPGRPGRNSVWVTAIPIAGEAAAAVLPVHLAAAGRPVDLRPCGPVCRTGEVDLRGGEPLRVAVDGPGGGAGEVRLPALPAPSGADLLGRVGQRMRALRSFRIDETLPPGPGPLLAHYKFVAPDRMGLELGSGAQMVMIGPLRFSRDGPAAPWQQEPAPALQVPSYPWDARPVLAAHLLGPDQLDGRPVEVLAFAEVGPGGPVWYRLWVDPSGLVERADMWAQAHFMVDRYADFDAQLRVDPPR